VNHGKRRTVLSLATTAVASTAFIARLLGDAGTDGRRACFTRWIRLKRWRRTESCRDRTAYGVAEPPCQCAAEDSFRCGIPIRRGGEITSRPSTC